MFQKARQFFFERGILEVDCPMITKKASIDAHIDLIEANVCNDEIRYLHTSPEYCMKRLLADGMGDIYQLNHVFRKGEFSEKHNPEFTMAEWYRLGFSFQQMIDETLDFIKLFLGNIPHQIISYKEAFIQYTGLDYTKATDDQLLEFIEKQGLIPYSGIKEEGLDAILNLILGSFIEPHLGKNNLQVLAYYPASQAALAKTCLRDGENVAERFEIYYKAIELCNGYHELGNNLGDALEQKHRFDESNLFRKKMGKKCIPSTMNF